MDDDATNQAKLIASKQPEKTVSEEPKVQTPASDEVKEISSENRGRLVLVTINKGENFSEAANRAGITYSEINRILQMFKGKHSTDWSLIMAASTISVLPVLIVYLFGQKYIIEGITITGMKS